MTKYIFVTGGVVSSLGKGIAAASIGRLLKNRGLKVTMQKFDPYINIDPGTMSPYQHGEVFVTEDGVETDLDLGHYERFIDENLTGICNITTGKIYWSVLKKERKGEYLGKTVQVIPHITDEIKAKLKEASKVSNADILITEVGGTVGDIESLPFLEAIRQMRSDVGRSSVMYIHLTLVPFLEKSGELKTKPTQHSVKELRSIGIQPDMIICRTEYQLSQEIKEKLALFCDINVNAVIENRDVNNIYEVPLALHEQEVDSFILEELNYEARPIKLDKWKELVSSIKNLSKKVNVAIVGKYTSLLDAYMSLVEALNHAGYNNDTEINIKWLSAEDLEENIDLNKEFENIDGIIVPGGFGDRGIEGKIKAAAYARENKIPFLGLCLGMHCAVIEFARNVAYLNEAHSSEFDPHTPHPVIDLLPEQKEVNDKGGTMRLGAYPCVLKENSIVHRAYGKEDIYERHRHRYEFNNVYRKHLEDCGLMISGVSPDERLVEIIELETHPWFVGVQFHPEFKSRPEKPHILFFDFVQACLKKSSTVSH